MKTRFVVRWSIEHYTSFLTRIMGTECDISCHSIQIAEKKIVQLEASRDLTKTWLHTDMDAFYAAVEILDNPSLKGKPLAVGGMSMICTASYEVSCPRVAV